MSVPTPMLATPGPPPGTAAWSVELKFDGMRLMAVCRDGHCRLYSRSRREVTTSFPEVAESIATALHGRTATLDGELVAITSLGGSSFARLQRRIHLARPTRRQIQDTPLEFAAFDLLVLDDESTTALPYRIRRARLESLALDTAGLRTVPVWPGVEGARVLAAVADLGLEGVVSKKLDSSYVPGRSRAWVKSAVRRFGDALVLGWLPGTGAHSRTVGALILGGRDESGGLVYLGCVGSGLSGPARHALRRTLDEIVAPAPDITGAIPREVLAHARWAEAVVVADIAYREISADHVLRHPSFRGIKVDIAPEDVGIPD
ncbi:ATP-dependent DNA ligase (plasmid) [Nocardia sp. NBC_01377]|uniref:ATP-dependent DNA ligase n=1 Tax=Nocardia sp. NBC_01377 TaxID=2903595 RepID=UPI003254CDB7